MLAVSRISRMGALRVLDPVRFEKELRKAMREADGRLTPAAEALGVSWRQLARWLAEYEDIPRAPAHRPRKESE